MSNFEQIKQWLLAGKQIGKSFSFEKQGKIYWSSVAVQKWNNIYKVYIDEILENNMDAEDYEKEMVKQIDDIDKINEFIKNNSNSNLLDLIPCKGQKIFNPAFN